MAAPHTDMLTCHMQTICQQQPGFTMAWCSSNSHPHQTASAVPTPAGKTKAQSGCAISLTAWRLSSAAHTTTQYHMCTFGNSNTVVRSRSTVMSSTASAANGKRHNNHGIHVRGNVHRQLHTQHMQINRTQTKFISSGTTMHGGLKPHLKPQQVPRSK